MAKKPQKAKKVAAKRTMAFEHVKHDGHVERTYDATAQRLVDAIDEFNAAMREAHERDDMHVFCGRETDEIPMRLHYKICQVTHELRDLKITAEPKGEWRVALNKIRRGTNLEEDLK